VAHMAPVDAAQSSVRTELDGGGGGDDNDDDDDDDDDDDKFIQLVV
jgi:hypothetical protein